jgi:hypothetical protein
LLRLKGAGGWVGFCELDWGPVEGLSASVDVGLDGFCGEGCGARRAVGFASQEDGQAEVVGFGVGVLVVPLDGRVGDGWVCLGFWGGRDTGVLRLVALFFARDDGVWGGFWCGGLWIPHLRSEMWGTQLFG